MRKLIVGAQVSLDGVMQAPGSPTEDTTGNFTLGGWAMPHFDEESGAIMQEFFQQKMDLLLGRKTYEIFAAFWQFYDESGPDGDIAKLFNRINKYVVSNSGEVDTGWDKSVLLRDVEAVKRLKAEDGPNLVTQGSTELVHALLANDLVDAINMFTIPIVLGSGKKLFADGSAPHSFKLSSSHVCANGVVITQYERAGAIETNDTTQGAVSELEKKRLERMKREG